MPRTKRAREHEYVIYEDTSRGVVDVSRNNENHAQNMTDHGTRPQKKQRLVPPEDKENQIEAVNELLLQKNKSDAVLQEEDAHSDETGCDYRGDVELRLKDIRSYDYILIPRPWWDQDGENWQQWSLGKADRIDQETINGRRIKEYNDSGLGTSYFMFPHEMKKPYKWVAMMHAWQDCKALGRTKLPCDMQDIIEDKMLEFDVAFRRAGTEKIPEMWAIISALGMILNHFDVTNIARDNDEERIRQLEDILGTALLTVLSAIKHESQLRPDSRFLDLALVIGCYLEIFHDLPALGLDDSCQFYLIKAIDFFMEGGLDTEEGVFATADRVKALKSLRSAYLSQADQEGKEGLEIGLRSLSATGLDGDPWEWKTMIEDYKEKYGHSIELRKANELIEKAGTLEKQGRGRHVLGKISSNGRERS